MFSSQESITNQKFFYYCLVQSLRKKKTVVVNTFLELSEILFGNAKQVIMNCDGEQNTKLH